MKSMSTNSRQRKAGAVPRAKPDASDTRPAPVRTLAAAVWPGSDADPYILQWRVASPVTEAARSLRWPSD